MTKYIFCHHAVTHYTISSLFDQFCCLMAAENDRLLITSPTFNLVSGNQFFKLLCPIMRFSQLLLLPWLMIALNILNEHKI